MNVFFTKKAEAGLEKIFDYIVENFSQEQALLVKNNIQASIMKLIDFPELGSKIAGQSDKRVLFIEGNAVIYEIVIRKEPIIVIRNVRPRKTLA